MTPEPATLIMLGTLDIIILFIAWVTHRKVLALREYIELHPATGTESCKAR